MVLKTVSSIGGGSSGNIVSNLTAGTGITLTPNPITSNGTVAITNTGVTQGTYGGAGNLVSLVITPTGQINSASNVAFSISNTSVVAGTYGNSTAVSTFTVLSDGRLNAASNVLIANIVLGNAQLQVGQTTTSVGNLTLNAPVINNPTGNVVPAIPAGSIPNSLLANSTATLGNATITLGSTTTTVGNLTEQNVTVQGFNANLASRTANVTLNNTDFTVLVSTATVPVTVTLPTAVGISGRVYIIKKTDSGANNVSIVTTSAQTIDGLAQSNLSTQNQGLWVQSDNANWWIINRLDGRGANGGTF